MKRNIIINNKKLPVPSFFRICNIGGGASDKYRELTYEELYENTPILMNYHYMNYENFARKWLNQIDRFNNIADFLEFTRKDMIESEGFICNDYNTKKVDFNKNIYLLDSGAKNIINKLINFDIENSSLDDVLKLLEVEMIKYYSFANKYKFDFVVGFDTGGKYTSKGEERTDTYIINKNSFINKHHEYINYNLARLTAEYIKDNPNFYPKVLVTIHGKTPSEYESYTKKILELEKEYSIEFYGFALGGVASSKEMDKSWFDNLNLNKDSLNPIVTARATSIVSNLVGERPIHVLGGGSYMNIPSNYFSGATSFDCQTPGRRAYDGNETSTKHIFDKSFRGSTSKYLPGILNSSGEFINLNIKPKYIPLNKAENIQLCNCPACIEISNLETIKTLYSKKEENNEYYYLSRQLMNSHAILQHKYISEKVAQYDNLESYIDSLNYSEYKNIMLKIHNDMNKLNL